LGGLPGGEAGGGGVGTERLSLGLKTELKKKGKVLTGNNKKKGFVGGTNKPYKKKEPQLWGKGNLEKFGDV